MKQRWFERGAVLWIVALALLAGCIATPGVTPTPGDVTTPTPGITPTPGDTATSTPPAGGDAGLEGTNWVLVAMGPAGAPEPVVEGSEVTLAFEPGGQAAGSGGCNSYGGSYQVQDGTVTFGEIVHTERACLEQGIMEQEQRFFEALRTAGRYELAGDELTIWYNNEQGVLSWMRA